MNTKTGTVSNKNKLYSNVKGSRGRGWGRGQARLIQVQFSVHTERCTSTHIRILYRTVHIYSA